MSAFPFPRAAAWLGAACASAALATVATAQTGPPPARGELLYTTHCIACHTRQIHWRTQKLAVDWTSLVRQVRRWAGNAGVAWTEDEIVDVARYLNASEYRFEMPSGTGMLDGAVALLARAD